MNEHLALICGKSGSGKSASLRNLRDPESVLYLNCEAGKRLPFPAKFVQRTVTNPIQVKDAFAWAEKQEHIKVIIVDTLTFWLDMYISQYVRTAVDGRAAWGNFAEFFRSTMQVEVAKSTKKVIFTAHVLDVYNETAMVMETAIPVSGSLKNQGIEAYFSTVLMCQKVKIDDLIEGSDLLKITDRERAVGFKHVYQTQVTKDTINTRIRGPMMLWGDNETYIDNDIQMVIDRMDVYYQ
jgi:hypothetical protein